MKKFTKVFFVICLMLALVASLVACATSGTLGKDEQGRYMLAVPKVEINGSEVSWKKIRYCEKYGVKINDEEEKETTDLKFYLSSDGNATVKVRALGDNVKTVSSDYSEPISYLAKKFLDTPDNVVLKVNDSNIVIEWDSVEGATSYTVQEIHNADTNKVTYTTTTNSLEINKSNINAPNIYRFTVKAVSSDNFNSAASSEVRYEVTEKLSTPKVVLKDNITWGEITSATHFKLYLLKTEGVGSSSNIEDKFLIGTNSVNSSKSYSEDSFNKAIIKYKEYWERKNPNQTFEIAGSYKFYVQAVHGSHPEIYLDSDLAEVKRGDSDNAEIAVFKKPGKVQGLKIVEGTSGNDKVDKLTWEKLEDFKSYSISFYSNDELISAAGGEVVDSESDTFEDDITSRFANNVSHTGKVTTISVVVKSDYKNGILAGEETFLLDANDNKQIYVPRLVKELDNGDGDFKNYKKIENLGGLLYMMEHAVAGEKYYLAENIDGLNCNFYVGIHTFEALFDGNYKTIKNINFIVENPSKGVSLFAEIAQGAIFQNVIFNNITIKNKDNEKFDYAALIAKTNKGKIERVNLINSNFVTNCKTAGFVIDNQGEINGCGFLGNVLETKSSTDSSTSTGANCDAAAIAINNTGKIFNASVYSSRISASSVYVDVKAGGIAVTNSGSVTNSFVRECLVKTYTKASIDKQVSSIAGGLVAVNSGTISECYLEHKGDTSTAVFADIGIDTDAKRDSIAGGLVGRMTGGEISTCYVTKAFIDGIKRAGGLVAEVPAENIGNVKINNCYVFKINFDNKSKNVSSMVLKDDIGANASNLYCVLLDNVDMDTTNAQTVSSGGLRDIDIQGFAHNNVEYSQQRILKNMLYAKDSKFSVEYYSTNVRDNERVYTMKDGSKDSNSVKLIAECNLKTSGKNIDLYAVTITKDDTSMQIVLPIYVTVK